MDAKSFLSSTEAMFGVGLIVVGVAARIAGFNDLFSIALAPFGGGLILSHTVSSAARATLSTVWRRSDVSFNAVRTSFAAALAFASAAS